MSILAITVLLAFSVVILVSFSAFIYTVFKKTDDISSFKISVKDSEESIEYILRSIISKNPNCKIVIQDKGSNDDTMKIVEALRKDFENISIEYK